MIRLIALVVALAVVVFIVWWFFGKHEEATGSAQQTQKGQEATIVVNGGYSPATVVLKKGVPGEVKFDMQDSTACLSHVVFQKLGVDKDLTKQRETTVKIPTDKPGEYPFACGMDMFHGKVIVKWWNAWLVGSGFGSPLFSQFRCCAKWS